MAHITEFYGPVHVYLRREGGEFQAWVDPFAIIGTGRTESAALRHARDLLISHFKGLAEEIRRHGAGKVRILSPMGEDEKAGSLKVFVGGIHLRIPHEGAQPKSAPVYPDPIENIARVLPRARDYRLDLLPALAAI